MLRIRLNRIGKKHQPSYRVVVVPQRSKPVGGRVNEDLGWWNPSTKQFGLEKERVEYWLQHGAQSSETVHNLFVRAGILKTAKKAVHAKKKEKKK